jgi:hypothetical protein
MRVALLFALWPIAFPALCADFKFTGYAHDLDTGALLYVETHAVRDADSRGERREVLYREQPDAEPFARKTLNYSADRARPSVELVDQRSGYAESVTRAAGGFRVWARAGRGAPEGVVTLPGADVAVIDAGFDEFVLARWHDLQRGRRLNARFLVPSRLEAVNFRIRKTGGARVDGAAVSVIRLSLAGPLGWFLPDIEVSYRDLDRRLLRYRGLTNIRDATGKLLSAQIDFPDADVITGR